MQIPIKRWQCLVVMSMLVACQPVTAPAPAVDQPSGLPPDIAADARVYRIVPGQSQFLVLVYRAGSLARLGHNHVISSDAVTGNIWLADPLEKTVFQLKFPVGSFEVDDAAVRAEHGPDFSAPVDAAAIEGTYSNMVSESQLDAATWPEITLKSRSVIKSGAQWAIDADITIRGMTSQIEVPARVEFADDQLTVAGEFSVLQTELGLQPFSVMLGALQVRDQLDIRFRLVARQSIAAPGSR